LRRRAKKSPDAELLAVKKEQLGLLEEQSRRDSIDLFYGDETGVNEMGYVPYAWQFKDEKLGVPSARGKQINCFGLVSRSSQLLFQTSHSNINAGFIVDFFEGLSLSISKKTVVVLDNAKIHVAQKVKADAARNDWAAGRKGDYSFSSCRPTAHTSIYVRGCGKS